MHFLTYFSLTFAPLILISFIDFINLNFFQITSSDYILAKLLGMIHFCLVFVFILIEKNGYK